MTPSLESLLKDLEEKARAATPKWIGGKHNSIYGESTVEYGDNGECLEKILKGEGE